MKEHLTLVFAVISGALGMMCWQLSSENAELKAELQQGSASASVNSSETKVTGEQESMTREERLKELAARSKQIRPDNVSLGPKGANFGKMTAEERKASIDARRAAAEKRLASKEGEGQQATSYQERVEAQISSQVTELSVAESWDEETTADVEDILLNTVERRKELQDQYRAGEISREELLDAIKTDKTESEQELTDLVGGSGPRLMRDALRPPRASTIGGSRAQTRPTLNKPKVPSAPQTVE